MNEKTPTTVQLKKQCMEFYCTTTGPMKESLEKIWCCSFDDRLDDGEKIIRDS